MKILILMPCDEKWVHAATGIFKNLSPEVKEVAYPIPMYMEYLIDTRISKNWLEAFFDAQLSARAYCDAAQKNDLDLLVIGNVSKDYKFDAVFNFQDIEQSLPYEDNFAAKVRELAGDDETLNKYLTNWYTKEDSKLALRDCTATAEFINKYFKTDPKLENVRAEFADKIGSLPDLEGYKNENVETNITRSDQKE